MGRGQTFETSVSPGSVGRSFFERGDTRGRGGQEGRFKEERRVYRGARHVSFLLIIIFNPIHCMVQRFALTPTFEIFLEVFRLLEGRAAILDFVSGKPV